jgi:hypothetical protein
MIARKKEPPPRFVQAHVVAAVARRSHTPEAVGPYIKNVVILDKAKGQGSLIAKMAPRVGRDNAARVRQRETAECEELR